MKKFIAHTTVFLLFASVSYVLFLNVWYRFTPPELTPNINYAIGAYGHLFSRISELENYGEVDILFLGSSHTYRGFDTRIFLKNGYKTFNLGSSAQTPVQTKVLVDRYLDRLNPKLVIYEVFPPTFMSDGVESSLDVISNDENDLHTLRMAFEINNIKTYNTLIYGLTRDWLGLNESFTEPSTIGGDTYVSGGFVEKEIGYFHPKKFRKRKINLRDYQLEAFSDIVETVKGQGIELMLVYAPITKVNYESFVNTDDFDEIMKSYSGYYNFNEMISLDDSSHFYNAHHLNQLGVELFNEKLIGLLKEKEARTQDGGNRD